MSSHEQKYYTLLWDGFRYHPLFSEFQDKAAEFMLDVDHYRTAMLDGKMFHLFHTAWMKDEARIKDRLYKHWTEKLPLVAMFLAANYSFVTLYDHKLKRFLQNFSTNTLQTAIMDRFEN